MVTDRYLWTEWSDADINSEKWDAGAKKAEKGKPATPSFFEDSDGQPTLPESLASSCTQWKRIPDIYSAGGGTAVFEEQNAQKPLSILQSNNHLLFSPFVRSLIGSIRSLQDFCKGLKIVVTINVYMKILCEIKNTAWRARFLLHKI